MPASRPVTCCWTCSATHTKLLAGLVVTDTLGGVKASRPGIQQLERSIVDTVTLGGIVPMPISPSLQELPLRGEQPCDGQWQLALLARNNRYRPYSPGGRSPP